MADNLALGNIVEGKVVRIKPFGAIVSLSNSAHGLVHISHISAEFVQDINDYLSVGDIVRVKIISIDEAKTKISLSIKEAEKEAPVAAETPKEPETVEYREPNFEDKMKSYLKASNERLATINKRNKKR